MAKVERDDQFYMTLVTIQVEDCLFRIPRYSLESQSKIFRDMFSLPPSGDAEGSSDNNPIRLEGITRKEFKRFLEVLFNGPYATVSSGFEETAEPCLIFDMWFPVMKLARMWGFDAIHRHAIKSMPYEQIDKTLAEKVALAVHHDIQPWLLPGLNDLARRGVPLGNEDLKFLGPELALKVAAIRESLIVDYSNSYHHRGYHPKLISGPRDASMVDFTPVIKQTFRISG